MVVTDSQPNRRLVHVCTDAGLGATIAPLARQTGLLYLRFDHAFAACLDLLRGNGVPAVLLVALDGLARVEADLLTWARSRWADLPIWVHGSTARLNGHLAAGRVKLIQLAELPKLLADLSGPQAAELQREFPPETPTAQEEFTSPSPAIQQPDEHVEAADSSGIADGWGEPNAPSAVLPGEEASDEANENSSRITDRAEPVPQRTSSPPLRLRPPDLSDRPVLTPDELAALLGPEGIHGG